MDLLKLVKTASIREHMDAHYRNEISYSKAVDLINEDANKQLNLHIGQKPVLDRCECSEPNEEPIKLCMNCNGYLE